MKKVIKFFAGLLCIFLIFMTSLMCGYAYVIPASYVSLHANASINYSLNIYNRVIDVTAGDETGEKIIDYNNFSNMDVSNAIEVTLEELISGGYITKDNSSYVLITVTNYEQHKAESILKKLEDSTKIFNKRKEEIKQISFDAVNSENIASVSLRTIILELFEK